MFCYFERVTRHIAFKQCARCFLEKTSLGCLTVGSEFLPEKPTLNRDVWVRWAAMMERFCAAKHLELVNVHHLVNPSTDLTNFLRGTKYFLRETKTVFRDTNNSLRGTKYFLRETNTVFRDTNNSLREIFPSACTVTHVLMMQWKAILEQ